MKVALGGLTGGTDDICHHLKECSERRITIKTLAEEIILATYPKEIHFCGFFSQAQVMDLEVGNTFLKIFESQRERRSLCSNFSASFLLLEYQELLVRNSITILSEPLQYNGVLYLFRAVRKANWSDQWELVPTPIESLERGTIRLEADILIAD